MGSLIHNFHRHTMPLRKSEKKVRGAHSTCHGYEITLEPTAQRAKMNGILNDSELKAILLVYSMLPTNEVIDPCNGILFCLLPKSYYMKFRLQLYGKSLGPPSHLLAKLY